ncbi:N-6 DNA methylase [Haloferax sp. MBLA0076]|uniref:site-specific DNA-methyltransferase (adenine-specific) n=1 Tax=Haloferax litoreum TaxID=2666140 RepID=A0A6A8GKM6_9EURY|nr:MULTISPECIES: N-6 DNA methylase [Haloferax]KAB1190586.1 N-6 DNA methylase [Haloferax sp. CBA1148]MRX23576.1 N-6 DNA methylase [Haloferax litoreum]
MNDDRTEEIRHLLDDELSLDEFTGCDQSPETGAAAFFHHLFVHVLGFEASASSQGCSGWVELERKSLSDVSEEVSARLLARAGDFRVLYVELPALTRTAERDFVQRLTHTGLGMDWATEGTFIAVFHAPDSTVWHLVTPFRTGVDDGRTGRPVLRRYTLGEGQTHHHVSDALAKIGVHDGQLADRIDEAFQVDTLTEEFYDDYKWAFETLSDDIRESGVDTEDVHQYAHVTLTRLLCFYYLQRRGWTGGRTDFVRWFHDKYRASGEDEQFHETWLSALFFCESDLPEGTSPFTSLPDEVEAALTDCPPMNDGLFQPTDADRSEWYFSDSALASVIFDFLEQYNYTISEASSYDVDVAVDPSMLGKIYESFITEEDRDEAGIFYTPRVEVDLMCRLALYEQFCDQMGPLETARKRALVAFLFSTPNEWDRTKSDFDDELEGILRNLRIVDPACGSGAYLVGMGQVLTELFEKVGRTVDAEQKSQILDGALYGADIKPWAVRVAAFRLWLWFAENESEIPTEGSAPFDFSFNLYTGDSVVGREGDGLDAVREGGFDVVITNPPYVDHQHIAQQNRTQSGAGQMLPADVRSSKAAYKTALVTYVQETFGIKPYRSSDLYLYFFFRAIDLLRDGGTLLFLTSNTWLDTAYGKRLQQGLLELTDIECIVDNRKKRSFAGASINTALTVANRTSQRSLAGDVKFVALSEPYERVVSPPTMADILVDSWEDDRTDEFALGSERGRIRRFDAGRVVWLEESALWRLGGGTTQHRRERETESSPASTPALPGGTYTGNSWGQFLRAPSAYFDVLEAGADIFTPLSTIASVGSYLNTGGADGFFFVALEEGDPRTDRHVTIRNRETDETFTVESAFVVPFVESPQQVTNIDLSNDEFESYLVSIPRGTDLSDTHVRRYIAWGERRGTYHTASGRRGKREWWAIGTRGETNTNVVWPNRQHNRHFVAYNPNRTVTHRFYRLDPHDGVDVTSEELAALLNFSPTALFTEVLASTGLGLGVLDVTGRTLDQIPVVDPAKLSESSLETIRSAFRRMANRPMGSLHDELGATTAEQFDLDAVVSDRRAIDCELFEPYLDVAPSEQVPLYRAILETVNTRITKSRSL